MTVQTVTGQTLPEINLLVQREYINACQCRQSTNSSSTITGDSTPYPHRSSVNKSNSTNSYVMQNNSEFVIPGCVSAGRTCQTDCNHYLRLHSTCNSTDCLQNVRNSALARCHNLCRISQYCSLYCGYYRQKIGWSEMCHCAGLYS